MPLIQAHYKSVQLLRTVKFNAFFPENYINERNSKDNSCRILFLLHDYGKSAHSWLEEVNLRKFSEKKKAVIIMPEDENRFLMDDVQRNDAFSAAAGVELVQYIQAVFGLPTDRECYTLAGINGGANSALRLGALYGDTFSKVIAIDPLPLTGELSVDLKELDRYGIDQTEAMSIFGDSCGSYSPEAGLEKLMEKCISGKVAVTVISDETLQHRLRCLKEKDFSFNSRMLRMYNDMDLQWAALTDSFN